MRNLAYEFRYPASAFIFHPLNPERIGLVVGGVYLEMLDVDHARNFLLCWNADMVIPVFYAHSQPPLLASSHLTIDRGSPQK
jgi:hypothetical protein